MPKITHQELIDVLNYNPITGKFYWKIKLSRKIATGDEAGANPSHSGGYHRISIYGVSYFAHILAWFYVKGLWPNKLIDHNNRDKSFNAIRNLREASYSENSKNSSVHKDNQSGFKGVRKNRTKYAARIYVQKKTIHIGEFLTAKEAALAYDKAAIKFHGQFAKTNKMLGLI